MANNACIAVGINRYHFFQPLSYAEADAQALRHFLIEEAGLLPERCLLLTDTALPLGDRSTYPTRDNIINLLDSWCQKVLQPGDLLWFFFSGYGVSTGNKDYLMPIDGNPLDIANTGLSVRSLFQHIKQHNHLDAIALLDINRSQSLQSGVTVGQETLTLASDLGIPTILSCQLDEFSHEATALNHGLFTSALLEALRFNPNRTVASLEQYLRQRLPELSQHYWQPPQTPLAIIPGSPAAGRLLIEPKSVKNHKKALVPYPASFTETANTSTLTSHQLKLDGVVAPMGIASISEEAETETHFEPELDDFPNDEPITRPQEKSWWLQLLSWGVGTTLLIGMILGVFLKIFNPPPAVQTSASPAPTTAPSPAALSPGLEVNRATLQRAKGMIQNSQVSQYSEAIQEARNVQPGEPLYEQAQAAINRWSEVILDLAEGRAIRGDFPAAIAAAQLVPQDRPIFAQAQEAIAQWQQLAEQQRANQIILQAAEGLINETQASSYNQAITAASRIPPDQPGYAEAQKLIAQWSRRIYLIAQSRASRGEFQNAIETATLVPENTPSYSAAQNAIAKWKNP